MVNQAVFYIRNMRRTEIPIVIVTLGMVPKAWKGVWKTWKLEGDGDHRKKSMVEIGLNTWESSGDPKRHQEIKNLVNEQHRNNITRTSNTVNP